MPFDPWTLFNAETDGQGGFQVDVPAATVGNKYRVVALPKSDQLAAIGEDEWTINPPDGESCFCGHAIELHDNSVGRTQTRPQHQRTGSPFPQTRHAENGALKI